MAKPVLPPVVMIHGAFCGPWAFDGWARTFRARGHEVYTPTLRHHHDGEKPSPNLGTTSLLDYASDLEALLMTLEAPPILIGHSMGGLLVQLLAARCATHAAVLLAPSAPWGVLPSTPFEIASAQAMFFAGDFWNRSLWPAQWVANANALDKIPEPERDAISGRFVPESGLATFEIMYWAFDLKRASAVDPRDVTCPMLCLVGANDRVNPPSTVRSIAARYKGRARYEELTGHSHWLIGEPGWENIATMTFDWLGRLAVGSETETGARS